jgi:hypothetical protein
MFYYTLFAQFVNRIFGKYQGYYGAKKVVFPHAFTGMKLALHPPLKACTMKSMNADFLLSLLIFFFATIYLLSVSFLWQRKMSAWAYAFWGMFALLLPAFGPFFVIAYRPGKMVSRKRGRQKSDSRYCLSARK